ncbi:MAG TPA: amino acid adenylation domain-containing protein [Nitrospira sp.]|nr:amino acid adenylation domain-containing protein [Nitrospira sp.]
MIDRVPGYVQSLDELFLWRCGQEPEALAYAFVRDDLALTGQLTYEELARKVNIIAKGLRRQAAPGSRVLLLFPPGLDIACAFWACVVAGLVPVPAPSPDPLRLKYSLPRLRSIFHDAAVSLVLTATANDAVIQGLAQGTHGDGIAWATLDQLQEPCTEDFSIQSPTLRLAYLQYTSGSTTTPRGVMISHHNVLAQCKGLQDIARIDRDSRSLCWLPYFHDYGLVHGIIGPFYAGIPAFLMSPLTFLRRPLRWLEAIDRWAVTHSGAPNSAYDSCVKALQKQKDWRSNLQRWSVASCGAEPIHPETIERFCDAFAPHGFVRTAFTPAYGLAESTLVVSSAPPDETPLVMAVSTERLEANRVETKDVHNEGTRRLVACGRPLPDMQVMVVDPATLVECRPNEVGELWVSGPSVAEGYWNCPDTSAETFNVAPEGKESGRYLRTGDLGFLHAGQVFITGRLKDLIILNGRNLHPNDIELAVEGCHASLRSGGCAAFSIVEQECERLVIVHEIERLPNVDVEDVATALRVVVAERCDVPIWAVVLVRSGSIPRTSSGKIQRQACRKAYLGQSLPIIASSVIATGPGSTEQPIAAVSTGPPTGEREVETYLLRLFADQAGLPVDRMNAETSIVNFGLDSLGTSLIKNRVEQDYGIELTFTQLFSQWTIHDLALHIVGSLSSERKTEDLAKHASAAPATVYPTGKESGVPADDGLRHALSFSQERLWFLEQMQPGGALNHISLAITLRGSFDRDGFTRSLEGIVSRHGMLRTSFATEDGRAYQSVGSRVVVPIRFNSLRDVYVPNIDEEIRRWIREETLVPFDLGTAPLLRVLVLERSEDDRVCVITVHRLVADGWSLRLFSKELSALYNQKGRADCRALPPPQAQYRHYAQWQRSLLDSGKCAGQLSYWKHQLACLPPTLTLPTDRPRPRVRQFLGGARSRLLSEALVKSLETSCQRHGVTKFMLLYAAFTAWLQRCARTDDIVVGAIVANRRFAQWEDLFGYLVNTVALRMDLSGVRTAEELLARARQVVAEASDNQDVPFEQVIGSLNSRSGTSSTSLFNVMIVWEDDPLFDLKLQGLSASHRPVEDLAVEFDLTLLIVNGLGGLELLMLYDTALFDGVTVDRMLGQLEMLLGSLTREPAARLGALPLLEEEERDRVVVKWNETAAELPFVSCIPDVIAARIAGKLGHKAVVCGESHLTYRSLHTEAVRLAQRICKLTQGRNVRVALCAERSTQSLVGLLGILKAGAAYVPLDPNAPEHRQRLILEDAGASVLVVQRHLRSQLPFANERVIELEDAGEAGEDLVAPASLPTLELDHLAYVIYTSGSTGRPKGVEVTHRALLHSLAARLTYYEEPVDRCLLTFPLAFDGSITGIFWTLLHAGTLVIPSEDSYRDPRQLTALISRHQISHVVWVPSLYDVVLRDSLPASLSSLRVVVAAGERLPVDLVHRHHERLPEATLYNEYGPTEATVWSTVYRTNGTEQGMRVPIGKPIANSTIYLLDADMQPVPIGVIGEICIGGATLARGYHNQPALTDAKFLANPYVPGTRMYKTGDLGLFRPDGNIEFIGRADHQVKIRGHRVELDEVEAVLRDLPDVHDAVAILQENLPTDSSLIAFVTSDRLPASVSPRLQELMMRRVPHYMVPAAVIVLDALPLLPNGKVDRHALKDRAVGTELGEAMPIRPRDQIEQSLTEIWSEVLGRPATDIHQSFFALGGHSLLATLVVSRIREVFRVELPLRTLFDSPTIDGVAEHIRIEQRRVNSRPSLPPIVPVSRATALPLSYSQQRMWFIQQLAPEATAYNLLFVSRQKGSLKLPIFRQVADLLSRRHEAFRTTFAMTGAGLVQRIAPWRPPHLLEIDLRRLPKEQREGEARRLSEEEGARPFDLERGPLARISVVTLDDDDHVLVLNMHHIVGDQWSFGILGRDFAAYYNALCQNLPLPETPFPVQYADYAAWQRRCLTDQHLKDQEDYWTRKLTGLPILYLPTDFPRPSTQTFRGAYCAVELPETLIAQLKEFSSQRQTTSFMTMLACFQLLLSRYSGQTDVAVGSPIANRTQMVMEQLIGTFVNILVFRTDVSGNPSFHELVERVKETALGAFANQDYPFDRLVDTLEVSRDPSMAPLIQVLFNMVNAPIGDIQLWGLKWEPFEVDPGSAQFDLSLSIELEVAKKIYLTFNTDLFTRETAERFLGHFVTLLENALSKPTLRLWELSMMSRGERLRLLEEWNRTASDYPYTQCFPELFEGQAQQTPDAIALSMEGRSLSYHSLNIRANQLARLLREKGVVTQTVVGVCLERSFDMVVALLAVMKAGGTYVPLDPDYPQDRIRFMVEDSGALLVITTSALSERFIGQACRAVLLDREDGVLQQTAEHDLPPQATAEDLVYILYTSGSTGQPKGVEIRHRSLVNFLWSMKRQPGCVSRDVMLSVTTLSFDIAGLELYLPLIVGAQVEIVSRAVAADGRRLRECIERVQPTLMQATPATWHLLLDAGWSGNASLTALCGGEALPQDLARELCKRTKVLWNMYGPTETTIWSTIERVEADNQEITIGRPIANTEIYILDDQLQPVPIGVSGEVYIGGEGLARGYHRRRDMTADRFIPHPFSFHPNARLYRTGDLGRYRKDGKILHLGRMDHQVKIRGFRIELGEVESVLSRHPKLSKAVVTAREDQHGLKQLIAYVVSVEGSPISSEQLRSFVRSVLPDYMVPSYFMFLKQLPVTANKKVDRGALPPPDFEHHSRGSSYVQPRNGMEVQLTALWQQVLDVQEIGVHDNFFDLGGNSLKAAQLFFQLETVFGKHLPLATLFQAPTIAQLAEVLTRANWTPPWQSLVAIQPSGSATPIFMVSGVNGNVLVFAKLANLMGSEQPLYGLQARGLDGNEAPFTSVPEMASHYIHALRQVQPEGPYLLAGVCTGGLIVYEMAQQLAAEGQTATIFMLDTWHPAMHARHRGLLIRHVFMAVIIVGKVWMDICAVVQLPLRKWWATLKRKGQVLRSLFVQSLAGHIEDQDFQVQRLTKATLVAVARYRVRRATCRIINVVASRNQIKEGIEDMRHRWHELGNKESCLLYLPVENAGRMFVSPHVEELACHMERHFKTHAGEDAADEQHRVMGDPA